MNINEDIILGLGFEDTSSEGGGFTLELTDDFCVRLTQNFGQWSCFCSGTFTNKFQPDYKDVNNLKDVMDFVISASKSSGAEFLRDSIFEILQPK